MIVALTRGANLSLTKAAPALRRISVGLGWDVQASSGFDLDASAILLGASGKALSDHHFIFFNNQRSPDGTVVHLTDDPTGEGDDETITIDLTQISQDVARVVLTVSIYEAATRNQTFAGVHNGFIRIVDAESNAELARYDHQDEESAVTALIFGEVYRHRDEWKFRAVGQGWATGLAGVAREYGVNV